MQTNTNSSRPSPTPGQATDANAEGAMNSKGSDVLEIPLAHMFTHRPTLRIDWDRKKVAFEFDMTSCLPSPIHSAIPPALHVSTARSSPAQYIQNFCGVPDGAPRRTVLVHANGADAACGVNECAQPRPCQIHEAQNENARTSAEASDPVRAPRCTKPLPRRNQIVNESGAPAATGTSATQAGATYDNTNTPPASSDSGSSDDDDDNVPLNKLKQEVVAKRKRKAPATFEPVIKKEPTEKESGKRLHPERHQFKIRGVDEHVRWYYTESKKPIDAVPEGLLKPRHEALYVHRFIKPFEDRQVWIYVKLAGVNGRAQAAMGVAGGSGSRDGSLDGSGNGNAGEGRERQAGEWRRVQIGDPHPRLEGLVLHLLDEQGPRWVKPKSARDYASAKHKRVRWARLM